MGNAPMIPASGNTDSKRSKEKGEDIGNIILNHDFSNGLHSWHPNCCDAFVVPTSSGYRNGLTAAVVTKRKEQWQGLEQDITFRTSAGSSYAVSAHVGASGDFQGSVDVIATLRLVYKNSGTSYQRIAKKSVSKDGWEMLEGSFSLSTMPDQVVFYLEGPPAGTDLLIKSIEISSPSSAALDSSGTSSIYINDDNIIVNPQLDDDLNCWSGRGCKMALHDSMADGKITPMSGKYFASTSERKQSWNGIQQNITGCVKRKLAYEVTAVVRIYGNNVTSAGLRCTLYVKEADNRELYIGIASVQATDEAWVMMCGKFLLNGSPAEVIIFLEDPPPGTNILLNSLVIKHSSKAPSPSPVIEDADFGVNIIKNIILDDGTHGWFPHGNCSVSVQKGSPRIIPPMARDSLGAHEPLSGHYILATNRTQTWMGPAQVITDKVKLYLTYQVSAWVKIGQASGPQSVNVDLGVDDRWVNGGRVEISDDKWHEIGGSFRIEKQPAKFMVCIQGPAAGVDLMVAALQIFPVYRCARFRDLKRQTDKIRKRDVVLKFSGSDSVDLLGANVHVRQEQNNFPFGSAIHRTNIDNEDFNDFFVKNFNWAVFGDELRWHWTEPQEGSFNYKEADELLDFCTKNNIQVKGHCIFREVTATVQAWVQSLNLDDLMTAVQNRLTGLLTRYKGKFKHYDVNNEMMHGSFYQDRLGKEVRVNMFKTAHQLDPSAILFVNDYHVENGCDPQSSPERYIEHILDLQKHGAPIGGIGIEGHIDSPVGPIICSALDKLGMLGLPIWFTEVTVSSDNEYIRADDLEVMLREAYAHPAVEGIILWGFWELFMSRPNEHLVNAEGDLNEPGRRYLALKQEWLSQAHGHVDENGEFCFNGFHGSYEVEVIAGSKTITKKFVVNKGQDALLISVDI